MTDADRKSLDKLADVGTEVDITSFWETPLTVADVLKQPFLGAGIITYNQKKILLWNQTQSRWEIFNDEGLVFKSRDEAAACAEFLRLTGGEQ